jgi:integrase
VKKRGRYGDGCVYQREGGSIWWITWHEHGVKKFESSGSEDRQFAQKMLRAKLLQAGVRRPTVIDPQKVSYDDLRDNFLEHCKAKGLRSLVPDPDGKPTLNTIPRLDKHFSGYKAREVSIADLKRFRAEGKADGLSDARLNRYLATLRAMFNQARKDELITRAELPPYFPVTQEPNEARGAVFVKREWYDPLRKQLKEPLRSAFVLLYHTGIRVHEMLRLQWKHINAAKMIVTLPGEITKTGRPRMVPLPSDFQRKPGHPDELVFPLGNFRWSWYAACVAVKAGAWQDTETGRKKYVGPLLRHCRHTFVRNASDARMEEKRIMEITGHLTRSTFDRYNIGREEDVERARKVIEQFHRRKA